MDGYISIASLWLPIVLSAVIVFAAAIVVWMVLPHHKTDWAGIPNEGSLLEALRGLGLGRGQYIFPRGMTSEGRKDPDAKADVERGPAGYLVLIEPGPPNMGKNLGLYFLFNLGVSLMVGYLASRTLAAGTEYLQVFRVAATIGFLAYGAAEIPGAIWYGRSWSSTLKTLIDALVFGLLMGGVFGWLWP